MHFAGHVVAYAHDAGVGEVRGEVETDFEGGLYDGFGDRDAGTEVEGVVVDVAGCVASVGCFYFFSGVSFRSKDIPFRVRTLKETYHNENPKKH